MIGKTVRSILRKIRLLLASETMTYSVALLRNSAARSLARAFGGCLGAFSTASTVCLWSDSSAAFKERDIYQVRNC